MAIPPFAILFVGFLEIEHSDCILPVVGVYDEESVVAFFP